MCVVDMDDRRSHSGYSLRIITNLNFKVNQFRYLLNRTGVVLVIVRSLMPRGLPISWTCAFHVLPVACFPSFCWRRLALREFGNC